MGSSHSADGGGGGGGVVCVCDSRSRNGMAQEETCICKQYLWAAEKQWLDSSWCQAKELGLNLKGDSRIFSGESDRYD